MWYLDTAPFVLWSSDLKVEITEIPFGKSIRSLRRLVNEHEAVYSLPTKDMRYPLL